ncbi:MAG: M55 family metallopeptidase [Oscillospiraceae bacterium]|nr:M55 family metallopeptidase [Oscillospiraceae bacterium]MBQ4545032.1 M55 family metallopeptidase [Oscillospiraceae bacterium]MBQ6901434.1 M55 family metallopeptidase [Oscillospiraceae bacterium]
MNLYIMVDLEGISGIFSREQVMDDAARRQEGRVLMTEDINACVDAAKEAGVERIYVRDAHGGSDTVIYERLSENADYYICGLLGEKRYIGMEECDAVILLGYHAMAGTDGGVLEHTFNSMRVQNYWLNGIKSGEARFDALAAGEMGKPVIMVSGDDKLCEEVREFLPETVTCEVKKGVTWGGAMLLPKKKAHARIAECTKEAIRRFKAIPSYTMERPYTLRAELVERAVLPYVAGDPRKKIIDGRTYEVTADSIPDILTLR